MTQVFHEVRVLIDDQEQILKVAHGANLRRSLLNANLSPYTRITEVMNCGGRGLCATCGVWFEAGEPQPRHWHDKSAASFGYPRLSCQIDVETDMTVRLLTDKWVWGKRDENKRLQTEG